MQENKVANFFVRSCRITVEIRKLMTWYILESEFSEAVGS